MRHAVIKNNVVDNIILVSPVDAVAFSAIPIPENLPVDIGWLYDGESFHPAPPNIEKLSLEARIKRDQLLVESDVFVLPDRWAAMTPDQQKAWSEYRQLLRDIPNQVGFPIEIIWPNKPQ